MPTIEAIGTAVPENRIRQSSLRELAEAYVRPDDPRRDRLLSIFDNTRIQERAFAMGIDWYLQPHGWRDRMEAFARTGLDLAERAATAALERAGAGKDEVDGVLFVTTTGIATPSLDARLADRLGLRPDVLRLPVWGLGCSGGVAGLNRAADLARARPGGRFLVVALELCSLVFDIRQVFRHGSGHAEPKEVVAASLFADGCAAAIVAGDEVAAEGLRVADGASHLFPRTERVMGWDVTDHTLEVVISPQIPDIVAREFEPIVRRFLNGQSVDRWLLHPGGAKVLDAYQKALGLSPQDLDDASAVLREYGNMSSPTVLFTLDRSWKNRAFRPGEAALLASLGPGFSADLSLLAG